MVKSPGSIAGMRIAIVCASLTVEFVDKRRKEEAKVADRGPPAHNGPPGILRVALDPTVAQIFIIRNSGVFLRCLK